MSSARRLPRTHGCALVSFTGSSRVGQAVASTVSARFGKVLLECGGNNAVLVADDADLDLVIPAVVFGAVGTAGQRCTTTRRLIVHGSRIDDVLSRLTAAYRQVRIGDPLEPSTLMGPLIDRAAVDVFSRAVDEARAAGAMIVHGGRTLEGSGFFVEPTLVANIDNASAFVQRETFAPVLYVMRYDTIDEAIAQNNGVRARTFVVALHAERAHRGSVPRRVGQRLRHRQYQYRHVGRGNRRRIRR